MELYQPKKWPNISVRAPSDLASGGMRQGGEEKELGVGLTLNALPSIGRYRVTMRQVPVVPHKYPA